MLFWHIFGILWCPVVSLVTFSSNLSNFERNPKKTKNPKISKKFQKISKNPKIQKSPKNQKNSKIVRKSENLEKSQKITFFLNCRRKKEEKNAILLGLPIEEISLRPELSSPARFRFQGGVP